MVTNFPKRIVICGSGNSVMEGFEKGLLDVLNYEYTIGMNHWYRFASIPTISTFVDFIFYEECIEDLKDLPLVVGTWTGSFRDEIKEENTILLPFSNEYNIGNSWEKGFYRTALCGFFSLSLAIELGFTEIFLLGYDCCEVDGKTHFYQDLVNLDEKNPQGKVKWRGLGKEQEDHHGVKKGDYKGQHYNEMEKINDYFDNYKSVEGKVKIYNVSENSAINTFEKISYNEFFKIIKSDDKKISQTRAREQLREMIAERMI